MLTEIDIVSLLLFLILIILVISTIWTKEAEAPWLPTPIKTVHMMLAIAEISSNDVVYDLGCGDGRTVIIAARKYGARAVGIEINPLRYLLCQLLITIFGLRRRVKILYGDFFNKDLRGATVITCYLLQETNNKLERKLLRELHPGTKVVSNAFTFSSFPKINQAGDAKLYLIPKT
jgi:SAM-dependent methyltransferase